MKGVFSVSGIRSVVVDDDDCGGNDDDSIVFVVFSNLVENLLEKRTGLLRNELLLLACVLNLKRPAKEQ